MPIIEGLMPGNSDLLREQVEPLIGRGRLGDTLPAPIDTFGADRLDGPLHASAHRMPA